MKYPVYIDGKCSGELKVYVDGLMTVFEAQSKSSPKKPVRLYVFGKNESALLGTLQPHGTGARLVRRFSRTELRHLPESIDYAADKKQCEDANDTLWTKAAGGCLVSSSGLLAIPADAKKLHRLSDKMRSINGQMYLIFKRKV